MKKLIFTIISLSYFSMGFSYVVYNNTNLVLTACHKNDDSCSKISTVSHVVTSNTQNKKEQVKQSTESSSSLLNNQNTKKNTSRKTPVVASVAIPKIKNKKVKKSNNNPPLPNVVQTNNISALKSIKKISYMVMTGSDYNKSAWNNFVKDCVIVKNISSDNIKSLSMDGILGVSSFVNNYKAPANINTHINGHIISCKSSLLKVQKIIDEVI